MLFLETAERVLQWNEPSALTKIVGARVAMIAEDGYRKWLAGVRRKLDATITAEDSAK